MSRAPHIILKLLNSKQKDNNNKKTFINTSLGKKWTTKTTNHNNNLHTHQTNIGYNHRSMRVQRDLPLCVTQTYPQCTK